MQFKGQLLLPGESGTGLSVSLDVAEHHLAVESDGGGLGAWPLEVVDVERLHGSEFSLTVAGEPLRFVAYDTVAFAYTGMPAIEAVGGKSRNRSGFRSMLDRIWNGPEKSDQAVLDTKFDGGHGNEEPIGREKPEPAPAGNNLLGGSGLRDEIREPVEETPVPVEETPVPGGETPVPVEPVPERLPELPVIEEAPGGVGICPAVRSDGRRCESRILTSSGYCYPHDPRRAFEDDYELAQQARAQLKRKATGRLNRIYDKLDRAIRQVERGELDPETAMAMAQLARTMCAIVDMDETSEVADL